MSHSDRLNIAVFIDFDNIEIGVKNTLGQQFDPGIILDAIKERGEVVTKIAYADWTRAGEYSRALTQHAIRLVQRNLTPGGDKNGADINLALDALEMAFTHPHINAYVIVGGDSDFLSLVEKLKQYDKKVLVVGGRQFTSMILQKNCHEFIAYENLAGVRKNARQSGRPMPAAATATAPIAQAIPIIRRALKILADREVTPQTGLLKSTLLQLDSTFSERNYGASSFLDFVEKLAQTGVVSLKHAGRSVMVELNTGYADDGQAADAPAVAQPFVSRVPDTAAPSGNGSGSDSAADAGPQDAPYTSPAPVATESQEAGVARAKEILVAATHARWPMYLRNVKQILRQHRGTGAPGVNDAGFDERRYGFGGLMDLLKACQKEGLVRIERDRRGGLRVFQGAVLQQLMPAASTAARLPQPEPGELYESQPIDVQPHNLPAHADLIDVEDQPIGVIPVDTTAELLGRAKPKKSGGRTRMARPDADATPKKQPARSRGTRRPARGRKAGVESQ
ncbi:MAG: NYN domain-containing protein [Acidobacteriia bacterium]|nr:NYN domain-containing protein [Terriglobia bacterium]